jgi:hypothetical protein
MKTKKMGKEVKRIIREITTEGSCRQQHAGSFEDFIAYLQNKYSEAWEFE